jgi:hypothetical protein
MTGHRCYEPWFKEAAEHPHTYGGGRNRSTKSFNRILIPSFIKTQFIVCSRIDGAKIDILFLLYLVLNKDVQLSSRQIDRVYLNTINR